MSSSVPPPITPPQPLTFPALSEEQVQRLERIGTRRHVERGEILFKPSETNIPFFVMLSGKMDVVQVCPGGQEILLGVHDKRGEFTGEMGMLSGQRTMVLARMTEPGELLQIDPEHFRALIAQDSEIGDALLGEFIRRRVELIKGGWGNVIILGSRYSAQTLELREFLSRNAYPYKYLDLDSDPRSQQLLDRFDVKASEVPVVICNAKNLLKRPTIQQLAKCLGLNSSVDRTQVRDLIIAGAGPAGLAAAVYAASEGLDVLVIESIAPGGQAGSSSKIENYLGFPTGISGGELADRASAQAQKFGVRMMIARNVVGLNCGERPYEVQLDGGDSLLARAVVIATGAHYNRLALTDLQKFDGNGVYYAATQIEAQLCDGQEVAVVGGGNSAGQAAVFLSQCASKVHVLVRSDDFKDTMSRYLIQRLEENPRIKLHYNTEIVACSGEDCLDSLTWRDKKKDEVSTREIHHVFVMTGASPCTRWLGGKLALDSKGFILTGRDVQTMQNGGPHWPLERNPQMLETSMPGVFAVGDVRGGNVKRVASAVGEGAISISMVHRDLAEL